MVVTVSLTKYIKKKDMILTPNFQIATLTQNHETPLNLQRYICPPTQMKYHTLLGTTFR